MHVTTYADAAGFLEVAQSALEEQETVNSLLLSLALRLRDLPDYINAPPYLAAVQDGARLVAGALMTPPHNLVVTGGQIPLDSAFRLLVENLVAGGWHVPGVNGPVPLSSAFAQAWIARTGQSATIHMQMRSYELLRVNPPPAPPGRMRPATREDQPYLLEWLRSFGRETDTDPAADLESLRPGLERALKYGNYYLWDDGEPVALAGWNRPTRHGISVGPVYTPPHARRRGYATALVAALSQQLLDDGKRYVTLFTDLANPTANSIYQKIGFRPVVDYTDYRFS